MALAPADHVAHHGDLLGMTSKVIGAARLRRRHALGGRWNWRPRFVPRRLRAIGGPIDAKLGARCALARQAENQPRFGRRRRLMTHLAHKTDGALGQLLIRGELAWAVIKIVLETDANVTTKQQSVHRAWELSRTDAADAENASFGQEINHRLEDVRRIWHGILKAAMHAQHDVDVERLLVEARSCQRSHVLDDVGWAEDFPFGLDATLLHLCGQEF